MANSKEQVLKDIMDIRKRIDVTKGAGIREIDVFEEQVAKSVKRIEQSRYLAKKFNQAELEEIHRAYATLRGR